MGQKYLIDTNTVIKYLDEIFSHEALSFIDRIVDNDSKVSFITKIELLVWKTANPDDLIIRKDFLKGSKIYYIDEKIIEMTIMIRKATNMNSNFI
jgi:predicted nucleic acid-binding protein